MAVVVGVLDPWLEERERYRSPKRSLLPNAPPPPGAGGGGGVAVGFGN